MDGIAIGKYIWVRVLLDINNPIIHWTNINVGGHSRKILFRYEKLANFCYMCGRLNHMEKSCSFAHPDGLRYYGQWLRANGKNPPTFEEAARDLNRLNARMCTGAGPLANSPSTPTVRATQPPSTYMLPQAKPKSRLGASHLFPLLAL